MTNDAVLEGAKRDEHGCLVVALKRRPDTDYWDPIVVGSQLNPLCFWSRVESSMPGAAIDDQGNTLMVMTSTPPGAEPAGIIAIPADQTGSPVAKLVATVDREGFTKFAAQSDEPPRAVGPQMLTTLLDEFANRIKDGYAITVLPTADGDELPVLLDWSGHPLRFWVPDVEGFDLAAVGVPDETSGFVAVTLDRDMRPTRGTIAINGLLNAQSLHEEPSVGLSVADADPPEDLLGQLESLRNAGALSDAEYLSARERLSRRPT